MDPRAKMPVIFFIHGGGYEAGTTAGESGADLIREAGGGIVAVEAEYRLGIFGMFSIMHILVCMINFCRFPGWRRDQEKRCSERWPS